MKAVEGLPAKISIAQTADTNDKNKIEVFTKRSDVFNKLTVIVNVPTKKESPTKASQLQDGVNIQSWQKYKTAGKQMKNASNAILNRFGEFLNKEIDTK